VDIESELASSRAIGQALRLVTTSLCGAALIATRDLPTETAGGGAQADARGRIRRKRTRIVS
jgi:hypothetical protein